MGKDKKVILICSAGRSGSTLIRNILDLHRDISVAPELRFFDMALSTYSRYHNLKTKKDRLLFAENVVGKFKKSKDPLWEKIIYNKEDLINKLARRDNLNSIYIEILKSCSTKKDAEAYVDKIGTFFIGNIVKVVPNVIFIHAVRDGREVCASAHKRGDWAKSYLNIAEYWNESMRKYDYYCKEYNNGKNFYEIKYENLINNTKDEIEALFRFLNIKVGKDFFQQTKSLKSSSSFVKNKDKKGIFISQNFTHYFSEKEQSAINKLLNKTLKKRGYKAEEGKIDFLSLVKAKLQKFKIELHFWSKVSGIYHYFEKIKKLVWKGKGK